MKRAQYLILAMLSLLLFSCNDNAKTLKPVSSKLNGPLADCFEVVVKDYKIIGNQVNLEFVRIKEGMMEPEITADFLDENGNVLVTKKADNNSNRNELRLLLANKVGESSTVTFAIGNVCPTQVRFSGSSTIDENDENPEMAVGVGEDETLIEDALEEIDYTAILEEETELDEEMEMEEDEDEDEEEDETPTQSVQSSGSSKDWDKVLDDFESYVDQYLVLLKKSTSGDVSALTEYATMLEKAEKLEKDLNAAQKEMTNAQVKRYIQINKKMTDAAFEMYDNMY